jgi:hypothetical protein
MLVNFKKVRAFLSLRFGSLVVSLEAEGKKGFSTNHWRFTKRTKELLVFAIIIIILVSIFAFLPKGNQSSPIIVPQSTNSSTASPTAVPQSTSQPSQFDPFSQISRFMSGVGDSVVQAVTPKAPGTIESAGAMNSSVWQQVAANAWQYFQPDVGVDSKTGLPGSGVGVPYFTDWDLGVYIQAVMDANTTGLIGSDGDWGSSTRLEKVVHWLETRDLNSYGYPYWFYQSSDGKDYKAISDTSNSSVDGVDTGRLFVALNNLKTFNSSLAPRINNIVLNGRSNYTALLTNIIAESQYSTSIYAYYIDCGYASFWPSELSNATSNILNNIRLAGTTKTPENATLPLAGLLGDPLYCSVFETSSNPQLMSIARQVYLAHEAYYNVTGNYRAFSEGASLSTHWAYEWVVLPDNRTWVVLDESYHNFDISPMIYTKIALSFLALYNTTYAYNMAVYLEKTLPAPSNGYAEGVTEDQAQFTGVGLNTNGMIIGAAKYAIQNNP